MTPTDRPICPHCLGRHTTSGAADACAAMAADYAEVHDAHMAATYGSVGSEPAATR